MVTGRDSPLRLNLALFELTAVTVTPAPLATRLPNAVPLIPTTTLPMPSGAGVTASVPAVPVPVPESGMVRVAFDAVELIVMLPLRVPLAVGVNFTL
jgi:hypothetical protein